MFADLLLIATITLLAMASPGPDMLLIVKYCSSTSRWPAVACVFGICLGLLLHVSLAVAGIAAIIATSPTVYNAMKYAGAAYLIYIGVRCLLSMGGLRFNTDNSGESLQERSAFWDGLLCNVLNPKVTIFILAVFTQAVEPTTPVLHKILYGIFIVIQVLVLWNVFILLVRSNLVLSLLQKYQVLIDRSVGVIFILMGCVLIAESFYT